MRVENDLVQYKALRHLVEIAGFGFVLKGRKFYCKLAYFYYLKKKKTV